MALDTTTPSRILRRLAREVVVSSAIVGLLGGLGGSDLALAQQRVDAGDVLAYGAEPRRVVQAAGDVLEPQVEQLLLGLGEAGAELGVVGVAQVLRGAVGHQTSTPSCCLDRSTNLALMGSFWMARSRAALA